MAWQFKPLSLDRQHAYREALELTPEKASDYSFINIWGWAEEHGLEWSWQETCVWIRQTRPTPSLWAPVGDWRELDWPRLRAQGHFTQMPMNRTPQMLTDHLAASFGSEVSVTPQRGQWDYLYDIGELIQLKGKRFHKKKNLLSQFMRRYAYNYLPLSARESTHALALQEDWCQWRDCESQKALAAENRVIRKLFRDWEHLEGIGGGALRVDGRIIAYTIAEALTPEMLVIHIEKGDPGFKGVYQAINQIHLSREGKSHTWVNREQDLDSEGLRKAKLSYHPVEFIRKCSVRFNST